MKLNKRLIKLRKLFVQYAPVGATLLDFKQYENEYIILYRYDYREDESCFIINYLNSDGLYNGRYYYNYLAASIDFSEIKVHI